MILQTKIKFQKYKSVENLQMQFFQNQIFSHSLIIYKRSPIR